MKYVKIDFTREAAFYATQLCTAALQDKEGVRSHLLYVLARAGYRGRQLTRMVDGVAWRIQAQRESEA